MIERPILFSGEMVLAILAGRKTQTRRVLQRQPGQNNRLEIKKALRGQKTKRWVAINISDPDLLNHCPYGKPGDRLWVRETFWEYGRFALPAWDGADDEDAYWMTTGKISYTEPEKNRPDSAYEPYWRKRPSIHMPRWASRIDLRVTNVRVERVQEATPEDIVAEGAWRESWSCDEDYSQVHEAWMDLWDSINAKRGYGWDVDPWVWVVEFEREK